MRTAIYVRISRDRTGAGLGVDRQEADCRELAGQLGWQVTEVYVDNDISAYSGRRRPGYEALCAALEAGHADALICWHNDRLHRRPIELEAFIELADRRGIEIRTVRAGGFDLGNPSGRLVARMLGANARYEVEHSIERQRRAKQQAAVDGRYRGGRRSFGYEANGMDARPEEAGAIRQAVTDVLAGVSLRQVARDWNAAGLRTSYSGREFDSREVRKVLLRPRNAGIATHQGKRLGSVGTWDKIVDPEQFATLEAVLRDPSRTKSTVRERKHQGSGVYRCGICDAPMTSASQNKNAHGVWQAVYTCSASRHLFRDAAATDALVTDVVVAKLSEGGGLALPVGKSVDLKALLTERDSVLARKAALGEAFGADQIDLEALTAGNAALRVREERIEAQLAAARHANEVAKLVLAGPDLRKTWLATDAGARGRILSLIGARVVIQPAPKGRPKGWKPGDGPYFDPDYVDITWPERSE